MPTFGNLKLLHVWLVGWGLSIYWEALWIASHRLGCGSDSAVLWTQEGLSSGLGFVGQLVAVVRKAWCKVLVYYNVR